MEMDERTRLARRTSLIGGTLGVWAWVLWPCLGLGHEAHHHGSAGAGKDHMAAMQALKERISPELRAVAEPPFLEGAQVLEAASQAYGRHCAPCHGEDGRGDGPAAAGLAAPPANFREPAHAGFYSAGERFWIITHGVPEFGMPGFGDLLDENTRWGLVHRIGQWQRLSQ